LPRLSSQTTGLLWSANIAAPVVIGLVVSALLMSPRATSAATSVVTITESANPGRSAHSGRPLYLAQKQTPA
jgi:hypothetical protein